jgi:hypothetical protein
MTLFDIGFEFNFFTFQCLGVIPGSFDFHLFSHHSTAEPRRSMFARFSNEKKWTPHPNCVGLGRAA